MLKMPGNKSFRRLFKKMTKAMTDVSSKTRKKISKKPVSIGDWSAGVAMSPTSARRYGLFKPSGVLRTDCLPLMVMLHGCLQDAQALATSTRMNRIAEDKRFFVLYPEQDRVSNVQACWNWFDVRSGRAQREAGSINAMIDQICLSQPIDPDRIVLAGLSAGASMAALMATHRPERFRVLAMHSGISSGVARSSASAIMAMRGTKVTAANLPAGIRLPALLVIHGSNDRVVSPANGAEAAKQWAAQSGAKPDAPRTIRRGARYPATITDYRIKGKLAVSFCEISGLGHAWSGGASGQSYSDPKGPDASGMIWTFAAKQFASR